MSNEDHANVPVVPPVLFALGLGAGFLFKWLGRTPLVPRGFEAAASWAGAAVSLVGLAFGGWGLLTFVRAKTTPHPSRPVNALVTWGPFRVSRNPMYVGMSAGAVGCALIANTPWILATLPHVWLAVTRLVIDREEAYLERKFGDEYRSFRARTRRWL